MSWLLTMLICAMLLTSMALLRADEPPERKPGREAIEDRDGKSKDGRRTNNVTSREEREKRREAFLKMSPEEREAKRKEIKGRLEARIAELHVKQSNQVITAQETRELTRSEQILKRFEQSAATRGKAEEQKGPGTK